MSTLKSGRVLGDASGFHGSYTNGDGQRVRMTSEEAAAIWEQFEAEKAQRAVDMPDEQSAIQMLWRAQQRLKEIGWKEAVYCPKDGSTFKAIEAGSTGIFDCAYHGEWPKGSWSLFDGGDIWPGRPILFKLLPEAQAAEDARMAALRETFKSMPLTDGTRK